MTFCLVFSSYSFFGPFEEDEQVKNTLCNFLHTWMDTNPEDFCGPIDFFPLKYMKAYLSAFVPPSDHTVHFNRLLTQLQEEQAKNSQARKGRARLIWGDTHPQTQRFNCCKSAGKAANLEPDPTRAPDLDNTETTRSFCDACASAAMCGSSRPASTPDNSHGTCVSTCL